MIPPDMLQEQHSEDMFRLGNSEGMFRRCGGSLFPFARAGLTWWINNGMVEGHVNAMPGLLRMDRLIHIEEWPNMRMQTSFLKKLAGSGLSEILAKVDGSARDIPQDWSYISVVMRYK